MALRYLAFLASNNHRTAREGRLSYIPLAASHAEAAALLAEYARLTHTDPITDLATQGELEVAIGEGIETVILPPSAECGEQASFVAELLKRVGKEDAGLLAAAYDLEAAQPYVLPATHPMPVTTGEISRKRAEQLARPLCEAQTEAVVEQETPAVVEPDVVEPDNFLEWKPEVPHVLHLLYREARQILIKVELKKTAVLKITYAPRGLRNDLGDMGATSFLLPIFQN